MFAYNILPEIGPIKEVPGYIWDQFNRRRGVIAAIERYKEYPSNKKCRSYNGRSVKNTITSANVDGGTGELYVVRMSSRGQTWLKIGITSEFSKRQSFLSKHGNVVKLMLTNRLCSDLIFKVEQLVLHSLDVRMRYNPMSGFSTECIRDTPENLKILHHLIVMAIAEVEIDSNERFGKWTMCTYEDVHHALEYNDFEQFEVPVPEEGTMSYSYNVTRVRTNSE
jgi:hypothetical protein